MIRGVSPSKKTGSGRRSILQDSSATGTRTEDIALDDLEDGNFYSLSQYLLFFPY